MIKLHQKWKKKSCYYQVKNSEQWDVFWAEQSSMFSCVCISCFMISNRNYYCYALKTLHNFYFQRLFSGLTVQRPLRWSCVTSVWWIAFLIGISINENYYNSNKIMGLLIFTKSEENQIISVECFYLPSGNNQSAASCSCQNRKIWS